MRTHCNNNQLYAQVQPKRRILTKLESVLNLTRSGIISLTLVFCMLLTLLPATTVRAMAAEAGEETVTSWEDLVQKYGQTDGSDGITNITIPQGTVVRATVPLVVGSGEYSITGGSIYADFQLSADSTLTIDGPETKIYGTLTNEGTCNYNGGAIRKIVNTGEGALTISGVELGEEDLSDGSGSDDGFYTTIENNGKGEITINSCTIYNCHIDNIREDSRLNFYECEASPRSGDSFLITNQGIAAVNSGEYHGIVIENKSLLTILGGTFCHTKITSTSGSVAIYSGTFQGEEGQSNSGSRIRCEGGTIFFSFDTKYSSEAPRFIKNECLDTSPIYIGNNATASVHSGVFEGNASEQNGGVFTNDGMLTFLGMGDEISIIDILNVENICMV